MTDGGVLLGHLNLAAGYRGGERQTELLVRGLAEIGWHQRLVARRGDELAKRCAGVPRLEIATVRPRLLPSARALSGVALVQVHEGRSVKTAFAHALAGGAPYVVTRRNQKGPSHTPLHRLMYRRAAAIVALSSAVADALRALESSLNPVIIPSATSGLPVDAAHAAEIRARTGAAFLVGHVGALDDAAKGQRQLIALAERLGRRADGIHFMLVGDGVDEAALKAEAKGMSNVHFAGRVDNVGDYLAAFDIFAFPSRHEGLGSILLDALAFGLPVVATRVGGIPDVVADEVNGFLCEVDDIDAMADAIMRLSSDSALAQRIGAANRARAESFSPELMVERYDALYRRLLEPYR